MNQQFHLTRRTAKSVPVSLNRGKSVQTPENLTDFKVLTSTTNHSGQVRYHNVPKGVLAANRSGPPRAARHGDLAVKQGFASLGRLAPVRSFYAWCLGRKFYLVERVLVRNGACVRAPHRL
jgi:hypothetical protein